MRTPVQIPTIHQVRPTGCTSFVVGMASASGAAFMLGGFRVTAITALCLVAALCWANVFRKVFER